MMLGVQQHMRTVAIAAAASVAAFALPAVAVVGTGAGAGGGAAAKPARSINADTLDTLDSTDFALAAHQPFAVSGQMTDGVVGGLPQDVATVTIHAPAGGTVLLTAQATFNARESTDQSDIEAQLMADGVERTSTSWGPGDVDNLFDQHQTVTAALPVTAGSHTYALRLSERFAGATRQQLYSQYADANVTVTYLPGSPQGDYSEPPSSSATVS